MHTAAQIFGRLKSVLALSTDKALAERMGVPLRRLQTWKHRNSIPIKEIITLCDEETLDINFVLLARTHQVKYSPTTQLDYRGVADVNEESNCIRPPKNHIEIHSVTCEQIVDTVHLNIEWAKYVLGLAPEKLAEIRVIGNNMAPWVTDGDIVLIDVTNTTIVSDAPYALLYDDTIIVIKRLLRQPDGSVIAKSDNQYCDDEYFPLDANLPKILGRVLRRLVR